MVSQKSISSSPTDQTRSGSWDKPLKAPRMDEAERKDHLDEPREQSREKPQLCISLPALLLAHLPKLSVASYPCPQLCARVLPGTAGREGAVPTCCSSDEGEEVLHAFAPSDAPLQQPLVSTLPVQELCCGTEHTDGIRACLPDPEETLQRAP